MKLSAGQGRIAFVGHLRGLDKVQVGLVSIVDRGYIPHELVSILRIGGLLIQLDMVAVTIHGAEVFKSDFFVDYRAADIDNPCSRYLYGSHRIARTARAELEAHWPSQCRIAP